MTPPASTGAAPVNPAPKRVVVLSKRYMPLDEQLGRLLETQLAGFGYQVFTDKHLNVGVEWATELEQQLRSADAVIPLISHGSSHSEMLAYEIELAHEAAQHNNGRPHIIPIRINFVGAYPELIARILEPVPSKTWDGLQDNQRLVEEVVAALRAYGEAPREAARPSRLRIAPRLATPPRPPMRVTPANAPAPIPDVVEPPGGAVPLNSEFYLVRPQDNELRSALARYDSIILIKGARQMGKTSLLARGLQQARERGAKVVMTDFQKLNVADLSSPANLYLTLAESLAEQLQFPVPPEDAWDERRGANVNFERYIRREVLSKLNAPLVWGLDEVDRLFTCNFGSEVFGLFRSWHNERALDPSGPWAGLTLAIAYATEAHLFITDMNQSPFNVGTRLVLEDFTREQVAELNRLYRSPLKSEAELERCIQLVAGHPFLVRRALHELHTQNISLDEFEKEVDRDEGIFGDHLRRLLVLLAKDPALMDVVRGLVRGQPCPNQESFYRLRSAGVVTGNSPGDAHPRCQLYSRFLLRHIL
ncbi:MAG: TIR domain-containing protein [Pedosphaera sp.]|nr:TIR domain-containing protein [Pedosphaera sp.]